MLDMGRGVRNPNKLDLARFKDDLGRFDRATWLALVDKARAADYRLPTDPSELATIVKEVAATRARPRTVRQRRLARDCASVYVHLTGSRPQVINAKQLGHGDRPYYQLVEAAFGREGLPNWQDRAYEAARDLKRQHKNATRRPWRKKFWPSSVPENSQKKAPERGIAPERFMLKIGKR